LDFLALQSSLLQNSVRLVSVSVKTVQARVAADWNKQQATTEAKAATRKEKYIRFPMFVPILDTIAERARSATAPGSVAPPATK
jgi:hypothetical protein